MAKAKKDDKKVLKEVASELLKLMGVNVEIEVEEDKENEALLVNIKSDEEAGLLIGNRGRTINSIQIILGMIYRQKTGEWKRILVNVADWREREQTRLESLAEITSQRALDTGEPQSLYNLTSAQRRIVHMSLSENNQIETESAGEGKDRYLLVKPKGKK